MNKQITAKVESLSEPQLKGILANAVTDPSSESFVLNTFSSLLETYPLESVMSFTTLLVANGAITEFEWDKAIRYYVNPISTFEATSYIQLINCGYFPRLKSVVYCILLTIDNKNPKK